MRDARALAALFAVTLGCGGGADPASPPPPLSIPDDAPRGGPAVPLEDILVAGAEPDRLPSVLRRVGSPRAFERAPIPGGERQTWRYPGLSFTVDRQGGAERLSSVEVTGEGHRTAEGLRVGMTREAVTGILGQPTAREPGIEVYEPRARGGAALRVAYSDDDVVEALRWSFPAAAYAM